MCLTGLPWVTCPGGWRPVCALCVCVRTCAPGFQVSVWLLAEAWGGASPCPVAGGKQKVAGGDLGWGALRLGLAPSPSLPALPSDLRLKSLGTLLCAVGHTCRVSMVTVHASLSHSSCRIQGTAPQTQGRPSSQAADGTVDLGCSQGPPKPEWTITWAPRSQERVLKGGS